MTHAVILREDGTPDVGALTGALLRIGAALGQSGGGGALVRDLLLWVAFVAGAWGGAAGETRLGGTVLEVPAIAALLLALWRWRR